MAEIIVRRPEEGRVDRLRSYDLVVDGDTVATLRRGEEARVSVERGSHTVWARIDWARSPRVVLELGEADRAYMRCRPGFRRPGLFPKGLLYSTIWRNRYLDLEVVRVESSGEPASKGARIG